ncbi:FRG domain-containing protein [Cupriavidus basilensis]
MGTGALFRGQTRAYPAPDGGPSFLTSFDRYGCHPPRMQKWLHYASAILEVFVRGFDGTYDAPTYQAILQHYGWRSFFLDATSNVAVAAWFAGNKYRDDQTVHMSEDCFEQLVMTAHQHARYEPASGDVVLYVLSRSALRSHGLGPVDLVEITTATGRPRFLAQSAFMVGPLNGNLPGDCVVGCVTAPAELFRQYAQGHGIGDTPTLFPGPTEDPVLAALYSVPWVQLPGRKSPIFIRGLPLPEYELEFQKWHPAGTAFYSRQWLANIAGDTGLPPMTSDQVRYYLTPETVFHGAQTPPLGPWPNVLALFESVPVVIAECDGLIAYPGTEGWDQYAKGIFLEMAQEGADRVLFVTEVVVRHPGKVLAKAGLTRGKYFRVDEESVLHPISHDEECDCGSESHHGHHLGVVARLEQLISEGRFRQIRKNILAHSEVDAANEAGACFEKDA